MLATTAAKNLQRQRKRRENKASSEHTITVNAETNRSRLVSYLSTVLHIRRDGSI